MRNFHNHYPNSSVLIATISLSRNWQYGRKAKYTKFMSDDQAKILLIPLGFGSKKCPKKSPKINHFEKRPIEKGHHRHQID